MSALSHDDFVYAMETTQVLHEPDRRIDTFGSTSFEFHLISELMDSANEVRVREGRIDAERPRILKPDGYDDLNLDGFGEHAEAFRDWLVDNANIAFLKYGFNFTRTSVSEVIVHEHLEAVRDRIMGDIEASGNPLKAVIHGVDDTWEISLLKFTLDMIEKSHDINVFDFKRRGLL